MILPLSYLRTTLVLVPIQGTNDHILPLARMEDTVGDQVDRRLKHLES